jgi:hypothetical protein
MKIVYDLSLKALLALLLVSSVCAAPPAPPQSAAVVGQPNQGAWITNITWIYTNVAVKTPTLEIPQVTIYNGTNGMSGAAVLSWDNNPDGLAVGSRVYYGSTANSATNVFGVNSNITTVLFFNIFTNRTEMYWAWVTAYSATGLESEKSNVILFGGK